MYLVLFSGSSYALPSSKVTIKVIDESGHVIEGAEVAVSFWQGSKNAVEKGLTDSYGLITLSNNSIKHISYGAVKDGYYRTVNEYDFTGLSGFTGFRRWQPWNPTITIVLKKRINPTSLYVKSLTERNALIVPELNKQIGFDLKEGDWVIPYGVGVHNDFIFELNGKIKSNVEYDLTLKLTFSNKGDGIQSDSAPARFGSKLRLKHDAPINGYKNELIQRYASIPTRYLQNDFPEDRNYYFRVRTEKDGEGNVISALYGKIHGNIKFGFSKHIELEYYLNPNENDRNLEFDYKKNLFDTRDKYGRYKEFAP